MTDQNKPTTVTLNWLDGIIPFSEINGDYPNLDKNGFYAILGGTLDPTTKEWGSIKLLYIGQAYTQTIRQRIKQPHDAYTCTQEYFRHNPGHRSLVMTGVIALTSLYKVTQQLFDDVESCLIASNRPKCNVISKYSYSGRVINITNSGGFYPLLQSCSCSD